MSIRFTLLIVATLVFLSLLFLFNPYNTDSDAGKLSSILWAIRLSALYLSFGFVLFGHAVFVNKGNSAKHQFPFLKTNIKK